MRSATTAISSVGAGDLAQQLVGRRALAERPQLAQQPAGFAPGEPLVAVLAAQEVAQVRLERPRAEVAGDVERAVDVVQVALGVGRQLQRLGQQLLVAGPHARRVVGLEELDLVEQLGE